MKIPKNSNILFIAIVFFLMLIGNAYAQEQGFRWGKWSMGRDIQGGGGMPDRVVDSYVDSVGNTYIFGVFGKDARLGENGPYICPMDSITGYSVGNVFGCFLAKIDSLGTILWCRSVRGATQNHLTIPWNMVVKDDKITIAFDARFNYNIYSPNDPANWIYFCDTLIRTAGAHFYKNEPVTYFVTLDLDGNRIDVHDVRLWAKIAPETALFYPYRLGGLENSRFAIDEDDCVHLFTCTTGANICDDSLHKAYIIVDGDTNRQYPLNIHTQNGQYCLPSVYYKMSSDWLLLEMHPMIDTIVGCQPLDDISLEALCIENVVADGGDLYINGHFESNDAGRIALNWTDTDTFSVTVYLDSIHYLKIDNLRDFGIMPFLIKLNKHGQIVWVQQIYTESPNDELGNFFSNGHDGLAVDENYVYRKWWAGYLHDYRTNPNYYYLDSAHTIPMVNHTSDHALITSYDKQTGTPIDYYYVDTLNKHFSERLAILGDLLVLDVAFPLLYKSELCKINKYTKEVTKSMPITYSWTSITPKSMSINSNGWIFRSSTGEGARVFDSIPVSPTQETSIMSFFYDPSLDMRIKPCPQVDSLWGSMTVQHTATLSWHSQFSHIGYEVAYIPDGDSWDNATTIEVAGDAATIDLPDDHCYQFRLRGLCDGRREATSAWSDPVTLCPEVGIADVEHLTAAITPNPTTGMVRITSSEPMRQVVIYDLSGKEVQNSDHRTPITELTLDLSTLPEGSYIVKITTTTGNTLHRKLIKK